MWFSSFQINYQMERVMTSRNLKTLPQPNVINFFRNTLQNKKNLSKY